jgi:hypothetical protein
MTFNSETYQQYWFPGSANNRCIFDFTNDVMQIESPGFPMVPVDSDNFGNVITLPGGTGYYILGKYLMDSTFKTVADASGLFDNLPANVANCAFAPDVSAEDDAHLYFIDSFGLNYAHIKRNLINDSSIDEKAIIALPVKAMVNSPLSIVGDTANGGCWLFYVSEIDGTYRLVNVYYKDNQVVSHSAVFLPHGGVPTCIDISKNNIAVMRNNASLLYGQFTITGNVVDVNLTESVTGLSTVFIQSAFSVDGNTLFYVTEEDNKNMLNTLNLTTGGVTKLNTTGKYIALKRGLDNIIYGLSIKTTRSSTVLTVTPNTVADDFSVAEFYSPVNGGYFPSSGWSNNPF